MPHFEGLPVIVLHPEDADGAVILRELRRIGCVARGIWPPPQRLPDDLGALFCELDMNVRQLLASLGGPASVPLVGLATGGGPELLPLVRDCAIHSVLYKPIAAEQVVPSLYLAHQLSLYQSRLLKRIGKLDETLKSIRNVERAKAILMKSKNLDEHAAYHFMRRQAMEHRVPIGSIAATIIDANQIFG